MTRSDEDLRARLSRLDPVGAEVPVDPVTSPRAAELMERIMQSTDTAPPIDLSTARRRRRPARWLAAVAAAAAVAAVVWVGVGADGGGDDRPGGPEANAPTTLALSLPSADSASSCVAFDVVYLREMPVAFAGTATSVGSGQVTIDVDRWYRGGDAGRVTLAVHDGQSVALDGVDFRQGERYLVTATNGTVNGCGFSGPASPQLEAAYGEAFGS